MIHWSENMHYIGFKRNLLIETGTTLMNKHIYSVGMALSLLNRHILSPNRHFHLTKIGCPQTDTSILSELVHIPNRQCLFVEQTHSFAYHFQYWIKEFLLFLVPLSSCLGPTFDLNISFIRKQN